MLVAFSIYDVRAEAYAPPFCARTVSEGLRVFDFAVKDESLPYCKSPGDFRLFRVGQFNPETGVLVPNGAGPVLLEEGLSLVKEA